MEAITYSCFDHSTENGGCESNTGGVLSISSLRLASTVSFLRAVGSAFQSKRHPWHSCLTHS